MVHLSIKAKLIIALSAILFVAFLSMNTISYRVSLASVRHGAIDEVLPLLADNIYSEIQHDLMRPVHVSSLMAHDAFLKAWAEEGEIDLSGITKYLLDIRNQYGFVSTFFVSARTSRYYHFQGIHKQISPDDAHDVWYYDFLALDTESDLDVDTDEAAEGRLTVFINHRVVADDGHLLGVTGVGLDLGDIGAMLRSYGDSYGRTVYLIDESGVVQIHPDPSFIEAANVFERPGMAEVAQEMREAGEGAIITRYESGRDHFVLAARRIAEFGWYLVVEADEDAVYETLRHNFVQNLVIGLAVTLVVILICSFTVNIFQSRLEALATTDDLTGVPNRRHFMQIATRELARARRQGTPVAVAMLDIDNFKSINDTYGHLAGDQVLRAVAQACVGSLRESDLVGRVGGEEFALLLPETPLVEACAIANRVRGHVAQVRTTKDDLGATVSIGVTSRLAEGRDLDALMREADAALYQAKREGRDCIAAYDPGGAGL